MRTPQLPLRKTLLTCLASALSSAHGAETLTFNIDGIGPTATGIASAGAVSTLDTSSGDGVVNVSVANSGLDLQTSGTVTVTLTSLTLDDVGIDDDSATFVFSLTSAGGTIDDNGSDWGVDGNGAGRISAASESLSFSFLDGSSSVNLGAGATESGTFSFLGFNEVKFQQFDNADGDIATLEFGLGAPSNVTVDPFTFTADPDDMTVGYSQGGATNDGFKVNHFRARFQLETAPIPEPSVATLLLGLVGLFVAASRRK